MTVSGNRTAFPDLVECMTATADMDMRYRFYVEGPAAARSYVGSLSDDEFIMAVASHLSCIGDVVMMLLHARLANVLEDTTSNEARQNVASLRRILGRVKHMVPAYTSTAFVDDFCRYLGDSYLGDGDVAPSDESVVTAGAPIVSYVGRLVTPWAGITNGGDEATTYNGGEPDLTPDGDRVRVLALNRFHELVTTNGVLPHIMDRGITIREWVVDAESLRVYIKMLDDPARVRTLADLVELQYIGCRYLYEMADALGLEKATALAKYIAGVSRGDTTADAFVAAESWLDTMDESALESLLDDIDDDRVNPRFFKDRDGGDETEELENRFDRIDNFNITTLMNYIYTSRRYYADYYTNTAFMKMRNVGGYAFYREFIVIEPQDIETGKKLDFVYCPVRDQLNDRKVVIVTIDRDGKVFPVPEKEFNDFLAGRTPLAKKSDFTDQGTEAPDQAPDNETESTVAPKPHLDGVN